MVNVEEFYQEFVVHKREHEHLADQFQAHRKDFEEHRMEQLQLHTELAGAIRENTTAVASVVSKLADLGTELTHVSTKLTDLAERTQEPLGWWDNLSGTRKTINAFGRILIWANAMIVSIGGFIYVIHHL